MLLEGYNRDNLMTESLDIIPELVEQTIQTDEKLEYNTESLNEDKKNFFIKALVEYSVDYNEAISNSLELLYETKIQQSMFIDNHSIERKINDLIKTILPENNKIMFNLTQGNSRSNNIQNEQQLRLRNVTPVVSLAMEEDIFI